MRRPPPWWFRLPIYLDWFQLSLVIFFLGYVLAHGGIGSDLVRNVTIILAATLLIALDTVGGLGYSWALLPRAALSFPALVWLERTISWDDFGVIDWILLPIGVQQLWVLLACVALEVRLRIRPGSTAR